MAEAKKLEGGGEAKKLEGGGEEVGGEEGETEMQKGIREADRVEGARINSGKGKAILVDSSRVPQRS